MTRVSFAAATIILAVTRLTPLSGGSILTEDALPTAPPDVDPDPAGPGYGPDVNASARTRATRVEVDGDDAGGRLLDAAAPCVCGTGREGGPAHASHGP